MRLVCKVLQVPFPPKTRHYIGFPPELGSTEKDRKMMELADILLLEKQQEGVSLFRFTASGEAVGDTWHLSLEDAKHQAEFEFDGLLSPWISVPSDVSDVVEFALGQH
jgi:hypothetical protein